MIHHVLGEYRRLWFRSNKSFGLEIMQIRLGGLTERFLETARQIREYLQGVRPRISELEERGGESGVTEYRYRMVATGGWFI